jgi:hypothetical protein
MSPSVASPRAQAGCSHTQAKQGAVPSPRLHGQCWPPEGASAIQQRESWERAQAGGVLKTNQSTSIILHVGKLRLREGAGVIIGEGGVNGPLNTWK